MTSNYLIRPATPSDTNAVGDVLTKCYPKLMAPAYAAATLAAALPLMTKPNPKLLTSGTYYLAIDPDDRVIGCGGWTRERPGNGEVVDALAHIRHFATHPDSIGRGVGRTIYERCAHDAAAIGMHRFECYASLNAEGFYAALGFKSVRTVDIPMGPEVQIRSVIMECAI